MAQEKIIIKFKPDGHEKLITALNNLAKAQKKVLNASAEQKAGNKKLNASAIKMGVALKQQGKSFKDLGLSTKIVTRAFKGHTASLEKMRLAYKNQTVATGILGTRNKRLTNSNNELSLSFATMRSNLLLLTFAMSMGGRQIAKFAVEAAKIESMSRAFNTLAGGGEKATIAMDKLKKATDGTMSEFDLFQQANNAMILGVTKNSDEMAEMFDIAQRLGRALGVDTKTSVESLIVGIGRQSRMMLDNIGIVTRVEEANQAYASELGKTKEQLTDTEKRQAFLNATMIAAREKLATMPIEIKSTQDAYDGLGASASDASVALGKVFSELFRLPEMAEQTSDALGMFAKHIDTISFAARLALIPFFGLPEEITNWLQGVEEVEEKGEDIKSRFSEQVQAQIAESLKRSKFLKEHEKALMQARIQIWSKGMSAIGNIIAVNSKNAKLAANIQALASFVDAFAMASKASEQAAKHPLTILNPAYPKIIYGITLAQGIAQAAATKAAADKMETGGLIGGRRHSQGGTMINAEQGEFIMSRSAVESVGIENMNRINEGGGGGAITVNVSGNVMSEQFVEEELSEKISEAIRRGVDFGIS